MKLIEPKVELLSELNISRASHIARCARVCYGREYKEPNQEADDKMVQGLIKNGHLSMLRHASVYGRWLMVKPQIGECDDSPYLFIKRDGKGFKYASTNKQYEFENTLGFPQITPKSFLQDIVDTPRLFSIFRLTFCITTQISTSRELNRVSPNNIAERSTRYIKSSSNNTIKDFDFSKDCDIIEAYKEGFSLKTISSESGISVYFLRKILMDNNIQIRTRRCLSNDKCFSSIDSPEKAYLLGMIEADGNIRKDYSRLEISQHRDFYLPIKLLLDKVAGATTITKNGSCVDVNVYGKHIVEDLIKMGIVENKTYLQSNEDVERLLNSIPEHYYNSFYRGLFDGDGYLHIGKQKSGNILVHVGFALHTEYLVEHLKNVIKEITGYTPRVYKQGVIYSLRIYGLEPALKFGAWLYKDFLYPFGHPRKTSSYLKLLQQYGYNVNYPIGEFGDKAYEICAPYFLGSASPNVKFIYLLSLYENEEGYVNLISNGMKPEDARGILPLDTATKVIYTYSIEEWQHILDLRLYDKTGKAHPNCHVVMQMVKDQINAFAKEHNIDYQV